MASGLHLIFINTAHSLQTKESLGPSPAVWLVGSWGHLHAALVGAVWVQLSVDLCGVSSAGTTLHS